MRRSDFDRLLEIVEHNLRWLGRTEEEALQIRKEVADIRRRNPSSRDWIQPHDVYVIYSPADKLFWSNVDGWGSLKTADRFTDAEVADLHLPIGGMWVLLLKSE